MKNTKMRWIVAILAIVIVVAAVGIAVNRFDTKKLTEQLELGQKYLLELDYENAIVAYNKAIEIDPMSVEAYMGLADVYCAKAEKAAREEDYNNALLCYQQALDALQSGYDATKDETLQEKMQQIQALLDAIQNRGEDNETESVTEESWIEPQISGTISLQELLSSPSVCGVSWCDYDLPGFDGMIASLPPEDYGGSTMEPKPDYFYSPNDITNTGFQIYIQCYKENGSGYGDLDVHSFFPQGDKRQDIKYGYQKESKDMMVYCEYLPGAPASPYSDGFYQYMNGNGLTTMEDILAHIGVDAEELKEEGERYYETEYGVARVYYCDEIDSIPESYYIDLYESLEDFGELAKAYIALRNVGVWSEQKGIVSLNIDARSSYLYDKMHNR